MSVNNYFGTPNGISISSLTQNELDQISNIGSNIISPTVWNYLSMTNQSLSTLGSPQFQRLLLSNGTAALPSLSFTSDGNTGIYHESNDNELAFSTNGVIRLLMTASDIQTKNATLTLTNDLLVGTGPYSAKIQFSNGEAYFMGNVGIGTFVTTNALEVAGICSSTSLALTGTIAYSIKSDSSVFAIHDETNNLGMLRMVNKNIMIGKHCPLITTLFGDHNTGLGYYSLGFLESTATGNTAIGSSTGLSITSGKDNIMIGRDSGGILETGNNNILIGVGATTAALDSSNTIVLGNSTNTICNFSNTGLTTFTAGLSATSLKFPAGGNIALDWYETYTSTATFTGIWAADRTVDFYLTRIGNLVHIMIASLTGNGNNTSAVINTTAAVIPSQFRPSPNNIILSAIIMENGGYKMGEVFIAPTGIISAGNFGVVAPAAFAASNSNACGVVRFQNTYKI